MTTDTDGLRAQDVIVRFGGLTALEALASMPRPVGSQDS